MSQIKLSWVEAKYKMKSFKINALIQGDTCMISGANVVEKWLLILKIMTWYDNFSIGGLSKLLIVRDLWLRLACWLCSNAEATVITIVQSDYSC